MSTLEPGGHVPSSHTGIVAEPIDRRSHPLVRQPGMALSALERINKRNDTTPSLSWRQRILRRYPMTMVLISLILLDFFLPTLGGIPPPEGLQFGLTFLALVGAFAAIKNFFVQRWARAQERNKPSSVSRPTR
jgi:hypothetical protein